MWIAILGEEIIENIPARRAVGRTERQALERLRRSIEKFDLRRFPIMEEFIQEFSVRVQKLITLGNRLEG